MCIAGHQRLSTLQILLPISSFSQNSFLAQSPDFTRSLIRLSSKTHRGLNTVVEGLWLIAFGAFKKLLIADHIAILVNLSFDNLPRAGSADVWLATFAYGLQLYIDFSAYIDIARGSAMLMGITLPPKF